MTFDLGAPAPAPNGAAPALISESSTATFQADVMDASMTTPVLVDFWAPWCGPCRQLTPVLEKVVTQFGGKVRLVKINIDENQALAGQLGIQSIPAVFAFAGGRPVDGFMGAQPESEVIAFTQRIVDAAGQANGQPADGQPNIEQALQAAKQAMDANDLVTAEQIYAAILGQDPANDGALIGLAGLYLKVDRTEAIEQILSSVSEEGQKSTEYLSIRAALDLAEQAQSLGPIAELEARVAANQDDLQARFDLAVALAADGFKLEAAEALVAIMRKDREWNEDGARNKLLELFEAWGPADPATAKGRRLLSAALFS